MRLVTLPLSMLVLVLTLGGCLASDSRYRPFHGHGYAGYGGAPYGGGAYRPYRHSYGAWEPHRPYRRHHHHGPLFPHRPIWKKW